MKILLRLPNQRRSIKSDAQMHPILKLKHLSTVRYVLLYNCFKRPILIFGLSILCSLKIYNYLPEYLYVLPEDILDLLEVNIPEFHLEYRKFRSQLKVTVRIIWWYRISDYKVLQLKSASSKRDTRRYIERVPSIRYPENLN